MSACECKRTHLTITPRYVYVGCRDCKLQGPRVDRGLVPCESTPASHAIALFKAKKEVLSRG